MIKKTIAVVSVAALTGVGAMSVLPMAHAGTIDRGGIIEIATCNPCAAKKKAGACNPCAAKNACNPCNPCAAKKGCNPCNPCAAKKKSN